MTEEKEINYMLVQDGCGACAMAKKLLEEPIKKGKIKIVNVSTKEGLELAEKHDVRAVPTIINEKGDFQQKCFLSKDGKKMYCDDGSEKKIID